MRRQICAVVGALALVAWVSVNGHGEATGIIKERMQAMEEMGDAMKSSGKMFRGKATFDSERVLETARIVKLHSAKMTSLFPDTSESRTGHTTEALENIWSDWDTFAAGAEELEAAATALESAVEAGQTKDEMAIVFKRMARTCSSCHDEFRKE